MATGSVHAAAPAAKADNSDAGAIWAEWGVAAVLAGIDSDSGKEVRNKLYFVVHGPSYEKVVPAIGEVAGDCALKVAKALGNDLTSRAGELIPETAADETDAQFAARMKKQAETLERIVSETTARIPTEIQKTCGELPAEVREQFHAGISLRSCLSEHSDSGCPSPAKAMAGTISARRFELLYSWLSALKPDKTSMAINNVMLFGVEDLPAKAGAAKAGSRLLARLAPSGQTPIPWLDAGTAEQRQRAFELGVERARKKGYRLPGVVGRTLRLPQEILLQTADAVDEVAANVGELVSNPKARLSLISDEIARSRFLECSAYAGGSGAIALGKCAGYDVTEVEAAACLVGGPCTPKLNLQARPDAVAAALTIAGRYDLKELASANLLPRNLRQGVTLDRLQQETTACVNAAKGNEQAAIDCLSKTLKGVDGERYAKCLADRGSSWNAALKLMECVAGPQQAAKVRIAHCLANRGKNEESSDCFLAAVAPPDLAKALQCSKTLKDPYALAKCALGDKPGVKALADCLGQGKQVSWSRCASTLLGRNMPKEVADLVPCLEGNKGFAGIATCAASKGAPKEVRKAAVCLAQNGGDPFGTGACMVSDHLNPYQQVALQCAVSSGGAPPAFAACAGGRLLIMRVQGCLKSDFGSGNCFGPNNDFQKAIKAIFGTTITGNSTIGQVINAHIKVLRSTVALAGEVAERLKDLGENIGHAASDLEKLGESVLRGAGDAGRGLERAGRTLLRKNLPGLLKDLTNAPGKIVDQLIPHIHIHVHVP